VGEHIGVEPQGVHRLTSSDRYHHLTLLIDHVEGNEPPESTPDDQEARKLDLIVLRRLRTGLSLGAALLQRGIEVDDRGLGQMVQDTASRVRSLLEANPLNLTGGAKSLTKPASLKRSDASGDVAKKPDDMTDEIWAVFQRANIPDRPRTDEDDWHAWALCRGAEDIEDFFPKKENKYTVATAKRICRSCVVRTECLQEAQEEGDEFGIWGGMTSRERRKLKEKPSQP